MRRTGLTFVPRRSTHGVHSCRGYGGSSCGGRAAARGHPRAGSLRPWRTRPGSGAGSVASCSTSASTSDRCDGESLRKAFHSRKPCTVSLEGNPSVALTSDADVRFFIPCLLANQFHAGNTKPQVLREKYAKEDRCEQVMSRVARKGTFAEVEYTHLYAHLRLAFKIRVKSRITSHNRHDLDSQRKRELDPPEAVSVTPEMTFRPKVVSSCVQFPSLPAA